MYRAAPIRARTAGAGLFDGHTDAFRCGFDEIFLFADFRKGLAEAMLETAHLWAIKEQRNSEYSPKSTGLKLDYVRKDDPEKREDALPETVQG